MTLFLAKPMAALLLVASTSVLAAPARYLVIDHSSEALIDKDAALAVWTTQVDDAQRARLQKLYPVSKWGFISEVGGGFTEGKVCVVTARAMMVPRIAGSRLVYKPFKSALTLASQAGATREQCQALAASKLKEAIDAVESSLIAP